MSLIEKVASCYLTSRTLPAAPDWLTLSEVGQTQGSEGGKPDDSFFWLVVVVAAAEAKQCEDASSERVGADQADSAIGKFLRSTAIMMAEDHYVKHKSTVQC